MGVEQVDSLLQVIGGSGYHEAADLFQIEESPAGANQDGQTSQVEELFGQGMAEAGADAPCRNDDPGRGKLKSVTGHVCVRKKG